MSKHEKLLARLSAKPPPTNFRWSDLITLMEAHKFTVTCSGGSHHIFQHESGFTFSMSKTHPSGELKLYQVRDAVHALTTARKRQP